MDQIASRLLIFGLALLLGLRHGIDWDHIAAITDIIGTGERRRKNFITIIRNRRNFEIKSRWMVIFAGLHRLTHIINEKLGHKHIKEIHYPERYGHHTAFTVGAIHGIGAETPTQVLLFVAAAGAKGSLIGSLLVFTFVTGLICSNTVISLISISGYHHVKRDYRLKIILGLITAIFSLIVGTLFLLQRASFLPAFFGG